MSDGNNSAGRFTILETGDASVGTDSQGAVLRNAGYYMEEGLRRELRGDHEKALRSYSSALGEDPLHIEAWARQLWMLLYLEERIEARIWADKALLAYPNDPDILSLKSLIQWRNGLRKEAKALNDTALGKTRDCPNVWLARAEMQLDEDVKSASACFTHAYRAAAGVDGGLVALRAGDLLLRAQKYPEALEPLRTATREFSDSSWAWYGYGRALRAVGREDMALTAFERASRLTPRDSRYKEATKRKAGCLARLWRRISGKGRE